MMRRYVFLISFIFSAAWVVSQQSSPSFVSRLTARPDGATIRLAWQDSPQEVERYLIYRHTEPIDGDNFGATSFLGEVASGVMLFVDYPPNDSSFFYTVVVADSEGEPLKVFVPFRNKTTTGAAVDAEVLERSLPVTIASIAASVSDEEVILRYTTSSARREISVYRGTVPILAAEDLLSAILIDTITSSRTEYRDSPVHGLQYFYALFDTELLRVGKQRILIGQNVLDSPVSIPLTENVAPRTRNRPLPFLVLSSKIDSGEALGGVRQSLDVPTIALSEKATAAVESLVGDSREERKLMESVVLLTDDLSASEGSPQSELATLIREHFDASDWTMARKKLERFLLTRRSDDVSARARFYIAQTFYFERRYQEAFVELLYAAERYYGAALPWMDNILELLRSDPSG